MKSRQRMLAALLATLASVPARAQDGAHPGQPAKLGACVAQIDGLREPTGVAYGPDGLLYVCESLARQVSVLDAAGKITRTFGKEQLSDPRDLAVMADGRVVVSDSTNGSILVFDKDGKPLHPIEPSGGGLLAPEGLDVAGELVAVAEAGRDHVVVLRRNGSRAFEFGSRGNAEGQLNAPSDVAFAPDGSLFVADLFNQRIQHFSKEGKFLHAFGSPGPNPGQFSGPTGLAIQGGFVHVVDRDNSRMQVFTLAGELHSWYGIHALRPREGRGKLHYPTKLALSKDGLRAAIVEPMEDRVQILGPVDPNAEELPPLPALPPSHYGGAIDADGPILALTEPSIPSVLLFQMKDGEPIEIGRFGTYGSKAGQMLWPSDVAVDFARRRVYVADTGNVRLLVFEFRLDPKAEVGFDPERARFVAQFQDREIEGFYLGGYRKFEPIALWRDGVGGLCVIESGRDHVSHCDANLQFSGVTPLPKSCKSAVEGCAGPPPSDPKMPREQYVVDRLGGQVFELMSGKVVAQGLTRPSAVLRTQAGALYVSDEGAHALIKVGRQDLLAHGPGLEASQLFRPRGLAELAGGRVVVVDWGNHRGMIFDRDDRFVWSFGSQLFIRPTLQQRQEKKPEPACAPPAEMPTQKLPTLDGSKPWHSAERVLSNDGTWLVFWKATPAPIRERESFTLDVWVTESSTPSELENGIDLEIDAAMPEHGHGMNVLPHTTRAEDGHFVVEGTRLHMPGRWELYFDVTEGFRTERAQVTLQLE